MAKKKSENYLDYVPVVDSRNTWSEQDGKVTIHMVHRGFYAKIAQQFFHTSRVSHIDLDEMCIRDRYIPQELSRPAFLFSQRS